MTGECVVVDGVTPAFRTRVSCVPFTADDASLLAVMLPRWPTHPSYIAAIRSRILAALLKYPEEFRSQVSCWTSNRDPAAPKTTASRHAVHTRALHFAALITAPSTDRVVVPLCPACARRGTRLSSCSRRTRCP